MKRLYIISATIGALVPVGFVYQYLSSRYPVPETAIDLAILLDALGLSLLFSPIGAMAGLTAAFVINIAWKLAKRLLGRVDAR